MNTAVLVALIAAGLGLTAGGYYRVMGWIVVACLLLLTTIAASIAATASLLSVLGWTVLAIVAFDLGLVASLVIRHSRRLRTT